ncbi:MAG: hypothetical protein ACOVQM_04140, partial [Pirellula sp.]
KDLLECLVIPKKSTLIRWGGNRFSLQKTWERTQKRIPCFFVEVVVLADNVLAKRKWRLGLAQ